MANKILVLMVEIESRRDPATQNAINAVGNLVAIPLKQHLVLTIMKTWTITPSFPQDALGDVSLTYFKSSHAIDLTEPKGIADLAHRLKVYTEQLEL